VLRRSIDANGAIVISDYVPCLRFITRLQGWEAYLLGLQRRGRQMVVKIIDVEKHKQRAVDVAKDGSYVPDMVDVLLKAPLDDGGKPLSDGEIASLLLVSLVIDLPRCEQSPTLNNLGLRSLKVSHSGCEIPRA
jgi:hypothetical protein